MAGGGRMNRRMNRCDGMPTWSRRPGRADAGGRCNRAARRRLRGLYYLARTASRLARGYSVICRACPGLGGDTPVSGGLARLSSLAGSHYPRWRGKVR